MTREGSENKMKKILFVCHGNICRSVMAEYICKAMRPDLYCESAAVSYEEEGHDIYPSAKRCLDRHGIPYGRHRARRITKADYEAIGGHMNHIRPVQEVINEIGEK